jgi:hypothetical protein
MQNPVPANHTMAPPTKAVNVSHQALCTRDNTDAAQVAIQHTKLPNRETADRMKAFWAEHLETLSESLASKT